MSMTATFAGPSRASTVAAVVMSNLAKPKAFEKKDVNGDGKTDLVISFSQKDLTKYMIPQIRSFPNQ